MGDGDGAGAPDRLMQRDRRPGGDLLAGADVDVLRGAEPVNKERGVYLGELRVTLADGRRQSIQLYRVTPAPKAPPVLRFKIEQFQYEAGPADRLVTLLAECEAKAKGASG